MIFTPTKLAGAFIIDLEKIADERGFFARAWCSNEFKKQHLNATFVQCNLSFNRSTGTIRGLHYQIKPYEEAKLVRCISGAIYDVIIDLRRSASTYKQWIGAELNESNRRALYVPEGFAHAFQTLTDNAEIFYQVAQCYAPKHERGIRWDDSIFNIKWPLPVSAISEKDRNYPDFKD